MAVRVINHQREDGTWTGMVAVIGREPGIGNQDGTCLGLGNQLGSPHITMDGIIMDGDESVAAVAIQVGRHPCEIVWGAAL